MRPLLLALVGLALGAAPEPTPVVCDAAKAQGKGWDAEPLVAGADGWIFRASTDLSADFPVSDAILAGLRRYVDVLRARGTTLVLVLQPPRGLLAPDRVDRSDPLAAGFDPAKVRAGYVAELEALRATGVVVPDLAAAAERDGIGESFFFRRDHHWRPEGARVSARAVAAALAGKPTLTPAAFRSEQDPKPRTLNSSLGKSLAERCGTPALPPETYPRWLSVPAGAPDLLGDAPAPEVVVAGASNVNKGNEDFLHFAGALREALGADVLNVGVDGGGYNTGLLAWMDTPEGRAAAPKVLVWEVPSRLPSSLVHHFRQVVPTLAGVCAAPVAETTATLGAKETAFAAPPGLHGAGTYAVVEIADLALVDFTAVFSAKGGPRDPVVVQRGTRLPNNGRFFLEPQQTDAELASLTLVHATGAGARATVRWCRY